MKKTIVIISVVIITIFGFTGCNEYGLNLNPEYVGTWNHSYEDGAQQMHWIQLELTESTFQYSEFIDETMSDIRYSTKGELTSYEDLLFITYLFDWNNEAQDTNSDNKIDEDEWEETLAQSYYRYKITENTLTIYGFIMGRDEFTKQ